MRADRLIAALMVLQRRGRVTAAQLATELEVSERTARRDLEALGMSGVPVYSQPGRGGGWELVGGAQTNLTGLTSDEARALFIALGTSDRDPLLDAALRKLIIAIPETFRDEAAAASAAIKVDPNGWGNIGPRPAPEAVAPLSEAVISGRQCVIGYQRPADEAPSDRTVHPLGLVTKRGVWYLVADTERGLRTYRCDRVDTVELLAEPVVRPEGFDLDEHWERIVAEVETMRPDVEVRVKAHPSVLWPLRHVFSASYREQERLADGSVVARIGARSAGEVAHQLAGFGGSIELIDAPPEVEAGLREIAAQLAAQWL